MNFLNPSIKPVPTTAEVAGPHQIKSSNEVLLQNFLNGSLILGTILFFSNMYTALQNEDYYAVALILIAFGLVFLMTFARMLPYQIRVGFLTLAYYTVGVISLLQSGVNANALLYFLIAVLIFGILEERSYWAILVVLVALTVSVFSYLIQTELIDVSSPLVGVNSVLYWISIIVNFIFLTFLITAPIAQYIHTLHSSIIELDKSNSTLSIENQELAEKRIEFENDLDRRRLRLVTTRQISREISYQTDFEKLLNESVELIRTQLNYHQVAIFLNDERDENAALKAAIGEGSQSLLERNFRIRIHEPGIISSVILHGEPHITNDLTEENQQYKSSIQTNSQSELTVPLKVGQHTIGALDVQSEQNSAFGDEDLEMLQSIADQLATVIDKTTQIQKLKNDIASWEEVYSSYTQGTWQSHLKGSKEQLNFAYVQNSLKTDFEQPSISEDAISQGEPVIALAGSEQNPEKDQSLVSVPIILRDQVLGVLNIKYKGTEIPNDLVALVSNASDRLALALENARLLEQIQQRADREHLVGDISSKLRAAADIDSILRTTATELGKSLGIDEVRVQLKTAESM
jgi:GAF domain-containing protein